MKNNLLTDEVLKKSAAIKQTEPDCSVVVGLTKNSGLEILQRM